MLLNDAFTWYTTGGIFTALQSLNVPWKIPNISRSLDAEYHGNNSGQKEVSPLVRYIAQGKALTPEKVAYLAQCALDFYGENWHRLYEALQEVYNPIENYSMTETESGSNTESSTDTRTLNLSHGHTATNTDAGKTSGNVNQNGSTTADADDSLFGFNSSTASPADSRKEKGTNTMSTVTSGTDSNTRTEEETNTDSGTDENARSGNGSHNRNLTRSGNIGVTTSQQMLESEYELRQKNYFREVVFPDLDKMLTLGIY